MNSTPSGMPYAARDQWPVFHGYQPLNRSHRHIRLLHLAESNGNETLQCSLRQDCSLDDGIEYYALSYYWGAPSIMKAILVDGIEVQIRKTVFRFLQQLTCHFGSILVWLDALCINQKDVHERNWQVSMMGDIFRSATGVYAWLGEGDGDCDYAIEYAAQVDQPSSVTEEFDRYALHQYFGHLLQRPYWTRVWVIQEVVLARRLWLLYGEKTTAWDSFADAFQRLRRSAPSEDSLTPNRDWERVAQLVETRNHHDKERPDLLQYIQMFRHSRCMDARDKLYGLRGIAVDGDALRINYTQSVVGAFFDVLSLTRPSIGFSQDSSQELEERAAPSGVFEHSHALQRCIQMEACDVADACHDMEHDRLLGCLTYAGTVAASTPIDAARMEGVQVRGRYSAILVHRERESHYYGSEDVQVGDVVYELKYPKAGWPRDSTLIFAFRKLDPHSKPVHLLCKNTDLISYWPNPEQSCPTIDIVPFEKTFEMTEEVLLAGVEVCRSNLAKAHMEQARSDILLVHLSRAALFAFLMQIEGRVSELGSCHPSLFESVFGRSLTHRPSLCRCPADNEVSFHPNGERSDGPSSPKSVEF